MKRSFEDRLTELAGAEGFAAGKQLLKKKMLSGGEFTINDIALKCGFSDQSYFSKVFSKKYGLTPTDSRRYEKQ